MLVQMHRVGLDWHLERLRNKQYYSFVHYGDGEWRALTRDSGNSGGWGRYKLSRQSKKAMNKALAKYYSGKTLFFGCQGSMINKMNQQTQAFLAHYKLLKIKWITGDVFSGASKRGKLFPLIAELRKHRIVVVGPKFLKRLSQRLFNFIHFIEIPERTGWLLPSTFRHVLACRKKFGNGILYSFSAGIGTNILIPLLHEKMPGNFLIDFGSVWDPYCNRRSRRYMIRKHWRKNIAKKNLNL